VLVKGATINHLKERYNEKTPLGKTYKNKPIKRHPALQNLSREHHDILVFGLRLKKGIQNNASIELMNEYIDWFWKAYLEAHFEREEKHLFLIFFECNSIVEAKEYHEKIRLIFKKKSLSAPQIIELYQFIEKSIRFEERVLFNEIQEMATEQQLTKFSKLHQEQQACPLCKINFGSNPN